MLAIRGDRVKKVAVQLRDFGGIAPAGEGQLSLKAPTHHLRESRRRPASNARGHEVKSFFRVLVVVGSDDTTMYLNLIIPIALREVDSAPTARDDGADRRLHVAPAGGLVRLRQAVDKADGARLGFGLGFEV